MLRFAFGVHALVGGALIVPSLTTTSEPQDLGSTLAATERALDALRGIDAELRTGDARALERVLAATEAPLAPPRDADQMLERLRVDVARLLERSDESARREKDEPAPIAIGVDGALVKALETGAARARFEPMGYSADPVREGIARFLANEPARAVVLLEPHAAEPRAAYWLARARESLGEIDAARALYERLAADASSGELARRATFELAVLARKRGDSKRGAP